MVALRFIAVLIVLLTLLADCAPMQARTVTTRRGVGPRREMAVAAHDTLREVADSVAVVGYDKPMRASRETFFVVNHTGRRLGVVNVTFAYYDLTGRMLHAVTVDVKCDIPAGETRQLSIPTWDIQRLHYYWASPAPRRGGTPYDVRHMVNYVTAACQNLTLTENP